MLVWRKFVARDVLLVVVVCEVLGTGCVVVEVEVVLATHPEHENIHPTILFAALSCFGSLIFLCGLPQPYHPVFNAKRFKHASSDAFFLVIEAKDPKFDAGATKTFLEGLHAKEVVNVDE